MSIEGAALRDARVGLGYSSQAAAASAFGVSPRLFGEWERTEVPARWARRVREFFWPDDTHAAPALSAFSDMELLSEVGRRFAAYKGERDEAVGELDRHLETASTAVADDERGQPENLTPDNGDTEIESTTDVSDVGDGPNVAEPPGDGGVSRGRRGPAPQRRIDDRGGEDA